MQRPLFLVFKVAGRGDDGVIAEFFQHKVNKIFCWEVEYLNGWPHKPESSVNVEMMLDNEMVKSVDGSQEQISFRSSPFVNVDQIKYSVIC